MCVWRIYEYPLILEKKKAENSKSGQDVGVLHHNRGTPRRSEGPRHRRRGWEEDFPSSGSPQRSYSTRHRKCCVLFCSVIPLFQGLVYWTNEDPIIV